MELLWYITMCVNHIRYALGADFRTQWLCPQK